MNKTVIGGLSDVAERADREQDRADRAASDFTMIQRRIRTFYDALSQVSFPEDAPSWAPDWKEWLLTGIVAKVVEEPEIVLTEGQAAAETAEIVLDDVVEFPSGMAASDPAEISPEDVMVEETAPPLDETPVG